MKQDFEYQLDDIRVKLYEQSKDLSQEDFVKWINGRGQEIAERYGMTVITSAENSMPRKVAL